MKKKLPYICPSCASPLEVQRLACSNCDTQVTGSFSLPVLLQLTEDEQKFILEFIKSSGSLKLMAIQLKLSYPTIRNLLDDIIDKLKSHSKVDKNRK